MEEKLKVMVVDDNKEFVKLLTLFIDSQTDMKFVGSLYSGISVIDKIKDWKPNVLLLDMIMPDRDGLQVLKELEEAELEDKPYVIIMSLAGQEKITHKAISMGAMYYIIKPFDIQNIIEKMRDVLISDNVKVKELREVQYVTFRTFSKTEPMEIKVANIIHELGVPAHIKGYQYLREAIILVIENIDVISAITKTLYPLLSKKFKTTPSRVERAIRHAIELAWNRGDTNLQNKYFGYSQHSNKGKPTNSEFIALLADKLTLEVLHCQEKEG